MTGTVALNLLALVLVLIVMIWYPDRAIFLPLLLTRLGKRTGELLDDESGGEQPVSARGRKTSKLEAKADDKEKGTHTTAGSGTPPAHT